MSRHAQRLSPYAFREGGSGGGGELNCKRREGFVSSHPKMKCLIQGALSASRKFLPRNFDVRQLQVMARFTELCFRAKITICTLPRVSRVTGTNSFCIKHEFGEISSYFPHKRQHNSSVQDVTAFHHIRFCIRI